MAPVTDVDLEELESDLIEGELRQAFELALRDDRRRSIDAVDAATAHCFEELQLHRPDLSGRIALQWTLTTSSGEGLLSEPRILLNHGLRDEPLETCLLNATDGLSFLASGDGAHLVVEHILSHNLRR